MRATNPIVEENLKEGSLDWQLTRVRSKDGDGYRASDIEGYCSRQSVKAGESLDIFVSTNPPRPFRIEIFRTGYYGGRGARLMTTLGPFTGTSQPVPEIGEKNLHECRWDKTTSITIPDDWRSGVYLGRLSLVEDDPAKGYWQSYVVFIVTDDRPADILLAMLRQHLAGLQPLAQPLFGLHRSQRKPGSVGGCQLRSSLFEVFADLREPAVDRLRASGSALNFRLAYWLEQHGYDVSYCSNSDMLTPDRGLKCKAFLSNGHDEYWDIRQYESVVKLRDAGVNLLFFSGNSVCWVTPLRESHSGNPNRIMFRGGPYGGQYKYASDRDKDHGPFPHRGPDEGYLMGSRNVEPVNGGGDWICTKPEHWIFEGTGMKKGDRIPGLIGWEYHGDPPTDIPGLEIVG